MSKLNIPKGVKNTWETSPALFHQLDEEFGPFDMDAACTPDQYTALTILARGGNILIPPGSRTPDYLSRNVMARIGVDGLISAWSGKVWLNPPYGAALARWVPKAVHEVEQGNAELVCALLPARTGPRWWQENIATSFHRVLWEEGAHCGAETYWEQECHPLLTDLRLLPGRQTFVGAPGPATFDLVVVVWSK